MWAGSSHAPRPVDETTNDLQTAQQLGDRCACRVDHLIDVNAEQRDTKDEGGRAKDCADDSCDVPSAWHIPLCAYCDQEGDQQYQTQEREDYTFDAADQSRCVLLTDQGLPPSASRSLERVDDLLNLCARHQTATSSITRSASVLPVIAVVMNRFSSRLRALSASATPRPAL